MTKKIDGAEAYIALGSNMGDREQWLMKAVSALHEHEDIAVDSVSNIYETDPVGYTEQSAFLNMAIKVSTKLSPLKLLETQLAIESSLGRVRDIRWGPRTIDLDLLLYNDISMEDAILTLPHPRMMERAFVIVPLNDVLSQEHLLHNEIVQISAEALRLRKEGISLWKTINWPKE